MAAPRSVTAEPVAEAFARSQKGPAWPAVGQPNVQAATDEGVTAIGRTHTKKVGMVGRFQWAVEGEPTTYDSEGEALAAANRG